METLAEYLDRLMRQQNLTPTELAKRSQLDGHTINRFRRGVLNNPTVETILKLATGLDVNPHELFTAASGIAVRETPPIDPLEMLDGMRVVVSHPVGLDMLRQVVNLSPDQGQRWLGYMDYLKPSPAKGKTSKRGKP